MSVHLHDLEDSRGDVVDRIYFCSDGCHRQWCHVEGAVYGGWNGCHETDSDEACGFCGRIMAGLVLSDDHHVRCDGCGIGVSAMDGWTDGTVVFCGGLRGNGCDVSQAGLVRSITGSAVYVERFRFEGQEVSA